MEHLKPRFDVTFNLSKPELTYLWLVDIVGYSKIKPKNDGDLEFLDVQEELIINMFRSVYDAVAKLSNKLKDTNGNKREFLSDDATVIWTGDGAIVALKEPFDINSPLFLTHFFTESWNKKANWTNYKTYFNSEAFPKVHIALHNGDCRWLQTPTLRSPLFEVANCFGVDVNEVSRIGACSGGDGTFLTSTTYFDLLRENYPQTNCGERYVEIQVSINPTLAQEKIESKVIIPIKNVLENISGIASMESSFEAGSASVKAIFSWDADINNACQRVNESLQQANINDETPTAAENYILSHSYNIDEITELIFYEEKTTDIKETSYQHRAFKILGKS
jgi:copper chaperone CopZ